MSARNRQHRVLAWLFGILTLATLLLGGYALSRQSNLVIVFTLTPFLGVLALAFGLSSRRG